LGRLTRQENRLTRNWAKYHLRDSRGIGDADLSVVVLEVGSGVGPATDRGAITMKQRMVLSLVVVSACLSVGVKAQTVGAMLVDPPPMPSLGTVRLGMAAVRGLPYSAVEKTTTLKTLADGTTVTNVREEKKWRDGEGRERTERGTIKDGEFVPTLTVLLDPVAHTNTILELSNKIARVTPTQTPRERTPEEEAALAEARAKRLAEIRDRTTTQADKPEVEKLSMQNIAGVEAQGTRMTRVIPAGKEGNDRPITTVYEFWVAPELKITVQSLSDDPRYGKTTMETTELQRGEPDAALFQVPADFKVVETKIPSVSLGTPAQ